MLSTIKDNTKHHNESKEKYKGGISIPFIDSKCYREMDTYFWG